MVIADFRFSAAIARQIFKSFSFSLRKLKIDILIVADNNSQDQTRGCGLIGVISSFLVTCRGCIKGTEGLITSAITVDNSESIKVILSIERINNDSRE